MWLILFTQHVFIASDRFRTYIHHHRYLLLDIENLSSTYYVSRVRETLESNRIRFYFQTHVLFLSDHPKYS